MPSPFPGMNPHLEQLEVWLDCHESFMPRARDLLNAQVGDGYVVKIEERVYVHELPEEERRYVGRADVSISNRSDAGGRPAPAAGLLEPPLMVRPSIVVEELRESYLEIRDRSRRALVSVIELLSPANKSGSDRDQYLAKRNELLRGPVHFIEIDLLRGGERMPFDALPPCDYYAMVHRRDQPAAGLWPVLMRESLPAIPIPLNIPDPDVLLDLQSLVHEIYDAAGYAKYIYETPPVPPLSAVDAAWAEEIVRTAAPRA